MEMRTGGRPDMSKPLLYLAVLLGALSVLVRLLAWPVAFAFAAWLLIGYALSGVEPTPQEADSIKTLFSFGGCFASAPIESPIYSSQGNRGHRYQCARLIDRLMGGDPYLQ